MYLVQLMSYCLSVYVLIFPLLCLDGCDASFVDIPDIRSFERMTLKNSGQIVKEHVDVCLVKTFAWQRLVASGFRTLSLGWRVRKEENQSAPACSFSDHYAGIDL